MCSVFCFFVFKFSTLPSVHLISVCILLTKDKLFFFFFCFSQLCGDSISSCFIVWSFGTTQHICCLTKTQQVNGVTDQVVGVFVSISTVKLQVCVEKLQCVELLLLLLSALGGLGLISKRFYVVSFFKCLDFGCNSVSLLILHHCLSSRWIFKHFSLPRTKEILNR